MKKIVTNKKSVVNRRPIKGTVKSTCLMGNSKAKSVNGKLLRGTGPRNKNK